MRHPVLESQPSSDPITQFIDTTEGDDFVLNPQEGFIYGDGSCLFPNVKLLARAGWAIVQLDSQGNLLKAVFGNVPSTFFQDSLTAEFAAFSAAFDNGILSTYAGDCKGVLDSFFVGPRFVHSARPLADVWKTIHVRYPEWSKRICNVKKVKAHMSRDQVDHDPILLRDFLGNAEADRLARLGAELHEPSLSDISIVKSSMKKLVSIAMHLVDTLVPLRNHRHEQSGRVPRLPIGFSPRMPTLKDSHDFIWNGICWVCSICLFRTNHPSDPSPTRAVCQGVTPFEGLFKHPKGHTLWTGALKGGGIIMYCSDCWYYASAYPRKLKEPCRGKSAVYRPSVAFYLKDRKRPISKLPFYRPARLIVNQEPAGAQT